VNDWANRTLGEVSDVIAGQSPEGSFYNSEGVGLPFYQGKKDFGDRYIGSPTVWTSVTTKTAFVGDILMSVRAPVGPINFATQTACIGRGLAAIRAKALLNRQFLFYFLLSKQSEIAGREGAVFASISKGDIQKIRVPLPSLKEQERIVAILDEAFEGVATAKANAEKKLGKVREVLDSKMDLLFSNPGDDWKPMTLAEVSSDYGRGKSKHRPRNDPRLYGGPYPFVQTGDIRNAEQFITTYLQTYNEKGLVQSKLWPKGTLCITIAANIAETAILDFDACFPDSVIGVVADPKKANTRFIEYQLRVAKAQLQAKGKGSAQDNINLGTFKTHTFFFPSPRTQEKIVERLDSIALIAALLIEVIEQKVVLLDELKQSLLHQAFTGKL